MHLHILPEPSTKTKRAHRSLQMSEKDTLSETDRLSAQETTIQARFKWQRSIFRAPATLGGMLWLRTVLTCVLHCWWHVVRCGARCACQGRRRPVRAPLQKARGGTDRVQRAVQTPMKQVAGHEARSRTALSRPLGHFDAEYRVTFNGGELLHPVLRNVRNQSKYSIPGFQ